MYCSGFSSMWVGTSWGAVMSMVRNLSMVKCFLPIPTLFCRKKTGPGLSSLTARARPSRIGESTMVAMRLRVKPKALFT